MSVGTNPVALRGEAFEPAAVAVARTRLSAGTKALLAILLAKVLILGLVVLSYSQLSLNEAMFEDVGTGELQEDSLLQRFATWDGQRYVFLADHGYQRSLHEVNAYAPVLPTLMRVVTLVTGDSIVSGLIVSNVASVAALMLLFSLVRRRWGETIALRTLILLLAFPTAFFLSMVYTESLFLLLAVATFWALDRSAADEKHAGRWLALACAAAFMLPLTRWIGVLIVAPLALWALMRLLRTDASVLRQAQDDRMKTWFPLSGMRVLRWDASLLVVLAPLAGAAAYLAFMQAATGDYLAHVHATVFYPSQWSLGNVVKPWVFVDNFFAVTTLHNVLHSALDRIFFVGFVASMPLVYRKVDRPLFLFYLTMGLQPLLGSFMSYMRYLLPAFPLYIAYARGFESHRGLMRVAVGLGMGLQAFAVLYFAGAYWVA